MRVCVTGGSGMVGQCIKELMKKGFVNLNEYDGGMKDYRNKFPQDN